MDKMNIYFDIECYNQQSFFENPIEELMTPVVISPENNKLFSLDSHPQENFEENSSSYEVEQIELLKEISKEQFSLKDQNSSQSLCRESQGTAPGTEFLRYSSEQSFSDKANKIDLGLSYNESGHFLSSRASTDNDEEISNHRSVELPTEFSEGLQSFAIEEQSPENMAQCHFVISEGISSEKKSPKKKGDQKLKKNKVESEKKGEKIQIKNSPENIIKKTNNILLKVNEPDNDCPLKASFKTIIKKEQSSCQEDFSFEVVSQMTSSLNFQTISKKNFKEILGKKLSDSTEIDRSYKRVFCDCITELIKPCNLEYYVMNSPQFKRIYVDQKGVSLRDVYQAYQKKSASILKDVRNFREML